MKHLNYQVIVLLLLGFFLLNSIETKAQTPVDSLHLIARPYGDSIVLRWAPSGYIGWQEMLREGVWVERRKLGSKAFTALNETPLKAYSLMKFKEEASTTNANVIAAAHALYSEANPVVSPTGPMGEALAKYNEQNQRFMLAAVNADLSTLAADALGWRWVDATARPGVVYEYRIRLESAEGTPAMVPSNKIRLTVNEAYQLAPVVDLRIIEKDHSVEVQWARYNDSRFFAYRIEKSLDGINYEALNKVPLVKGLEEDAPDEWHTYIDELTENYRPAWYRVVGINSFADLAPASEAVKGQGIDLSAPAPPTNISVADIGNGKMEVRWENPSQAPDHAGFIVTRANSYHGNYLPLHAEPIPVDQLSFVDESPVPHAPNYYSVYSVDNADNTLQSSVAIGNWRDVTPPAQPVGLVGKVDSLGKVFLMWEPGEETDINGYRVYVSHARNREFLQITEDIVHQNYYFDSTTLETLTEVIYYKIIAVDHNFNPSPYSEILELRRPDKVAPNAPVISEYQAGADMVHLTWRQSASKDVIRQEVWRQLGDEDWQLQGILTDPNASEYLDEGVSANQFVSYKITAVDDAGLKKESKPMRIYTGNHTERPGVMNFSGTHSRESAEVALSWTYPATEKLVFLVYKASDENPLRSYKKLDGTSRQLLDVSNASGAKSLTYAVQVIFPDGTRSALSEPVSVPVNLK